MKKTLIVLITVVAGLALGVGGAFALTRSISVPQLADSRNSMPWRWDIQVPGRAGDFFDRGCQDGLANPGGGGGQCFYPERRGSMGPGMMGPGGVYAPAGERLTVDEAVSAAQEYIQGTSGNLVVSEVMEFSRNFYVVVMESDTDKGAMELLVDPYSGRVTPEMGPNRMWNTKYGRMSSDSDAEAVNEFSMTEAAEAAQGFLDENLKGATVEPGGIDFYGYYSFDYSVAGEAAGMLSVNGTTGKVWLHTWHGEFISEKEIEE